MLSNKSTPPAITVNTIKKESVPEKIIGEIKNLIDSGQLAMGSKLPSEREFARMLGVGRPALREALKALAILGVCINKHGEGNFLTDDPHNWPVEPLSIFFSIKKGALLDIYETRKALEMQAAGLAAQRRTSADLATMQTALDGMRANTDDLDRFCEYDHAFHMAFGKASKNQVLTDLIGKMHTLGVQTRLSAWETADQVAFEASRDLDAHARLATHIANGDGPAATRCVADHLDRIISRTQVGLLRRPANRLEPQ